MGKSNSKHEDNEIKISSSNNVINENQTNDPYVILDDDVLLQNLEENLKKMELAFKYFLDLKDPAELVKYKRALRSFRFISELCVRDDFKQSRNQFDLIYKYSMVEFFTNLSFFCFAYVKQFVEDNFYLSETNKSDDGEFKILKIRFLIMSYLAKILWNFTEISKSFRNKFHESKGTLSILKYLEDQEFVQNCLRFKSSSKWQPKNGNDWPIGILLLRSMIACFHNLTKIAETKQAEFRDMNSTLILQKFAEITENHSSLRLYAYLAITHVASDGEIETLPQTLILKDIIKLIKIGSSSLSTKNDLKRVKIDTDKGKTDLEATIIIFGLNQFNIIELLDAVYKFSVNDKAKPLIYQTFEMNTILHKIIIEGNDIEKEYALKLLYQLCFDPSVRNKVFSEDHQLIEYLIEFSKKQKTNEEGYGQKMVKGNLYIKA